MQSAMEFGCKKSYGSACGRRCIFYQEALLTTEGSSGLSWDSFVDIGLLGSTCHARCCWGARVVAGSLLFSNATSHRSYPASKSWFSIWRRRSPANRGLPTHQSLQLAGVADGRGVDVVVEVEVGLPNGAARLNIVEHPAQKLLRVRRLI